MKRILSKYKRSIIIDGKEWTWQIQGKRSSSLALLICNPSRDKKFKIMINQSFEEDSDYDCDPGCCCDDCLGIKRSSPITPEIVKKIIIENQSTDFKHLVKNIKYMIF